MTFEPKASTHSPRNALFLGEASAMAYRPGELDSWCAQNCPDARIVQFAESTAGGQGKGVTGFLIVHAEYVVLTFCGTNELSDWGINLKAIPVVSQHPPLPGHVHGGFNSALGRVWDPQISAHLPNPADTRPLWITGHSLGGALAVLAAARRVLSECEPVQGLYTFGQPRVGDDDFRDALNADLAPRYFRYVNDRDIVPRVPPFTLGYRHGGTEFLFHEDCRVEQISAVKDAVFAAMRTAQELVHIDLIEKEKRLESIADHHMPSYLKCLQAHAGDAT